MGNKDITKILAVIAAVGIVGAVAWAYLWDPEGSFDDPAPNDAPADITSADLVAAAEQRVFFGHMSVGKNILSGMAEVYDAHGVALPRIVETTPGQTPSLSSLAPDEGVLVHSLIGENRHPYRKLENFEAHLRDGLAGDVDVALVKFCYIDVRWDSDVDRLFTTYTETMDRLERDFPDVRFIHATAPLTTGPDGIKDHVKLLVGRDDNAARERYNELMRATYGPGELLDVARIESTAPDGTRTAELHRGYSSDGAHLNDSGSARVAVEFLKLVVPDED